MFRNQYDNDVTVLSPDGRIRQVEYAMEAVKQGSATVGLRSETHAVLVALKVEYAMEAVKQGSATVGLRSETHAVLVALKVEYAMEAVKQGSATVGLRSETHAVLVALKVEYAMEAVKQGSATVGLRSETHAVLVALKVEYAMEAVKQGSATVGLRSETHAVLVALKVEYAMEAVKQGSATVGLRSETHAVLVALKVEYAMEAVKQGSATVGLRSETHAVLVALKRAANDLMDHQKKVMKLDTHMGMAMAGLLSDGRILSRAMETECIDHRWTFDTPIPLREMVDVLEDKHQVRTQGYGRRPFGVGLLVAAFDDQGTHILHTCPSGVMSHCSAMAIGARAQSARTYLERHLGEFPDSNLEQLVQHGLLALRDTLPNDAKLNHKNTTVAVVGTETPFHVFDDEQVRPYIAALPAEAPSAQSAEELSEAPTPQQ